MVCIWSSNFLKDVGTVVVGEMGKGGKREGEGGKLDWPFITGADGEKITFINAKGCWWLPGF
jgi:hypothetical protein